MSFRGNRLKKKKQKENLYYPYTKEDMKRVQWCLNRDIGVAVSPDGNQWKVEIRLNKGDWKRDPNEYTREDAMKKMYEYYKYYYDKYNKQ
tara:strand:- start:4 stop:273 length:270 start_codon:yes stop_codon:yes gene_type:complete